MGLNSFCFLGNKRDIEMAQEPVECERFYFGNDLGVNYSPEVTKFRVWAPTARGARVFIYDKEDVKEPSIVREFKRDLSGTWVAEIEGDFVNKYFIYEVNVGGQLNLVVDPYTRGLGTNSRLGLIVDLNRTNPEGWQDDRRVKLKYPQDAVIYEVHVRDFSSSPYSGIKQKGKYLAFTEENTHNLEGHKTGLDHLKELGITHVHLQPVFDFATVNDTVKDGYNWGYDPYFYNVPEGSYSTNSADDTRIKEFKKMVKALHQNNMGIIMDVVYNHTYSTEKSPFNLIVPRYYYRFDCFGNYSNGSGTGNEIASEKPMVRKFILDSIKYWAEEYHIDGFRFDLMALHDKKTMELVVKTLKEIDNSIIVYGEPWMGGLSPLDPAEQFVKGAQRGTKIAVFNDHFRNAVKGDNDGMGTGFVSGAHHQVDNIKRGIVGGISFSDELSDFTDQPSETVNYVSSHDNLTLWDKLSKSNYNDSEEIRMKMDQMAQAIILTSQGIPFIQGGEEMLRTKWGNHNSYNAGDKVNQLKWERKTRYYGVFKYYQGLIKLRKEHPAFRMKDTEQIRNHLSFLAVPENTVGYVIKGYANSDSWQDIVVFHNPVREELYFRLPWDGPWYIVVDDKLAGVDVLGKVEETGLIVPPISTMVLYK